MRTNAKTGVLKRALVLLLALALCAGALPVVAMAQQAPAQPQPTVYVGDTALAGGDTILPDAVLTARYGFDVDAAGLAAYGDFALPAPLVAAEGSFAVKATAGEAELAAAGVVAEGKASITVDTAALQEGESIALSFDVACTIAPEALPGEDEEQTVALPGDVVVGLQAAAVPGEGDGQAGDAQKFGIAAPFAMSTANNFFDVASITGVELYRDSAMTKKLSATDNEVGKAATIYVKLTFDISDAQMVIIENALPAVDEYRLPLPTLSVGSALVPNVNAEALYMKNAAGSDIGQFGELNVKNSPASEASVKFLPKSANQDWDGAANLSNGYLWYSFELSGITNQKTATVEVPSGPGGSKHSQQLVISENKDRENALNGKTGAFSRDKGVFEWEVLYTPGTNPSRWMKDSFAADEMEFVAGSMKVAVHDGTSFGSGAAVPAGAIAENTAGGTTTLTVDLDAMGITQANGTQLRITYQTRLAPAQLADGANAPSDTKTYKNSVQLYKADGTTKDGAGKSGSVELKGEARGWMTKTGTPVPNTSGIRATHMEWTVTVYTYGQQLSDLVLYDQVENSLGHLDLTAGPANIAVTDLATDATTSAYTYAKNSTNAKVQGKDYTFSIAFNAPVSAAGYKIVYEVPINNSFYENPPAVDGKYQFENEVFLGYKWNKTHGPGPGDDTFIAPQPFKGDGIDARFVAKEATGYDPATGTITWKVTVNPNKALVTGGVITDTISGSFGSGKYPDAAHPLEYVQNSLQWLTNYTNGPAIGNGNVSGAYPNEVITINLNPDINAETAVFTYQTQVKNADHLYGNGKWTYYNKVAFSGTAGGGARTSTATASATVTSNMHKKTAIGYNYGTRVARWQIDANQDQMALTGAYVEDILPAHVSLANAPELSYVDKNGGGAVSAGVVANGGSTKPYYTLTPNADGTSTLRVELPDTSAISGGAKGYRITFNAKIDAAAWDDCKNDSKVTLTNKSKFGHDDYDPAGGFTASASLPISNMVVDKSHGDPGTKKGKGSTISYEVKINPNGIKVGGGVITDTLPEGTCIDMESVKLYEATVGGTTNKATTPDKAAFNKTGTFYTVDSANPGIQYHLDTAAHAFSITLPEGAAYDHKSYVLEYDLIVTETHDEYLNSIAIDGHGIHQNAGSCDNKAAGGGGGGGGATVSGNSLHLTVTCHEDNTKPLVGVKYHIYATVGGQKKCMGTAVTDENGKLSFHGLSTARVYTIEQDHSTLPDGYSDPHITFGDYSGPLDGATLQLQAGANHTAATNKPKKDDEKKPEEKETITEEPHLSQGAPQTGDATSVALWLAFAAAGLLGLLASAAAMMAKTKRTKNGI